jgi:hypothetical protein
MLAVSAGEQSAGTTSISGHDVRMTTCQRHERRIQMIPTTVVLERWKGFSWPV